MQRACAYPAPPLGLKEAAGQEGLWLCVRCQHSGEASSLEGQSPEKARA